MIDNCGITQIGWSVSTGSAANNNNAGSGIYQKGINIVTFTASDLAGNTGTCTFSVTVNDNEDPTFTCAGPAGFLNAAQLFTGDAGDAIGSDCAYTLTGGNTSFDPTNVMDNCPGPITVTYVVNLFGNATGFTPGPNPASLAGSTFSISTSFPSQGSFQVVWTITDAMGNSDQCTRWIRVFDGQDPMITCPSDPQVRTSSQDGNLGDCFYTTNGTEFDPTNVDDNCGVLTVFNDYDLTGSLAGEDFPVGSTTVTWFVTDNRLNTSSCSLTIVVEDDESPEYSYCPSDVTLPAILNDCNNDVLWVRPNENDWTDNCDLSSDLVITEVIDDPGCTGCDHQ